MNIFSKDLLMNTGKKQYTLTVSTNPASATVTLTYNGISYTSNTATVDEGTVISYSVYQATYGTTTGSVTMDNNKTLTCTGTYSTSTTNVSWTQPKLSSNGTMGRLNFAVSGTPSDNNYPAWKAVDTDTTGTCFAPSTGTNLVLYVPQGLKATKVTIVIGQTYLFSDDTMYFHCTNSSSLTGGTGFKIGGSVLTIQANTPSRGFGTVSYNLSNHITSTYKYFSVRMWRKNSSTYTLYNVVLTGTCAQTSYTYYWNTSVV